MTFVTTHYHFQAFTSTSLVFVLFAARLTYPNAQNVKTAFFIFDLTSDIHLNESFRVPPRQSRYDT